MAVEIPFVYGFANLFVFYQLAPGFDAFELQLWASIRPVFYKVVFRNILGLIRLQDHELGGA